MRGGGKKVLRAEDNRQIGFRKADTWNKWNSQYLLMKPDS